MKRYIDASALGDTDRAKIFEGNARRIFSRLGRSARALQDFHLSGCAEDFRAGVRLFGNQWVFHLAHPELESRSSARIETT